MTHRTTDALYEAIGPGITSQDPERVLLAWLDGPGSLLGEVDDVVRDSDTAPGWAGELTAESSHRTRWTGQLLGVVIPDGLTDEQQRALIVERPATRRGTLPALVAAARALLTDTRYVSVRERDTSAYHLTVTTYAEETPDPAAVNAALQGAKPAGLVLAHVVATKTSYAVQEAMLTRSYTTHEGDSALTFGALETT